MPVEPGKRTSPVSDSTTLNSVCRIGGPTEPRTFKKKIIIDIVIQCTTEYTEQSRQTKNHMKTNKREINWRLRSG